MHTRKNRVFRILMTGILIICFASGLALAGTGFRQRTSDANRAGGGGNEDIQAELQFGREVAARILGKEGLYDNPELTRYVNLVGKSLARFTNRPELDFHVAILNTDDINAYASPGGYIFITKGAIMQMQDESELAGVIAHEMGHITGKHIVNELGVHGGDSSVVAGFARFLGAAGDPVKIGFLKLVDKAMEILYDRGYKVEDEKEADASAVYYLAFSGYDPGALVRYFNRIKTIKGEPTGVLTKTHPSFEDRTQRIQTIIAEEGLEGAQYKKGKERFDAVKKTI